MRTLELKNDLYELCIVPEYGCHWTGLKVKTRAGMRDFLYPADAQSIQDWPGRLGSFLLAPWSNRIKDATFSWQGQAHKLRKNFPDNTAIHGDVLARPWRVERATERLAIFRLSSWDFGDFNFPFPLDYTLAIEITRKVTATLSIHNSGQALAPVGMGFHPYLKRLLTDKDEDVTLVLPAEKVYPAKACIPTGPAQAVKGEADLRKEKPLGSRGLDSCFTGLSSQETRFIYPGSGVEVLFRSSNIFTHAVVYTPNDTNGKPKPYFAVEPVTHANDGINLYSRGTEGTGVITLAPGKELTGTFEIELMLR